MSRLFPLFSPTSSHSLPCSPCYLSCLSGGPPLSRGSKTRQLHNFWISWPLSLQTKWMNNEPSTGSLWIPTPIVVLLWLFDLPYWNADDRPINNAKSRFPGGEAGREKHLAYRWKAAVAVPLSLWPRAALSFIGLNRQSIQQPCMRDEGMRQAVNDEEPKIKGLTPS